MKTLLCAALVLAFLLGCLVTPEVRDCEGTYQIDPKTARLNVVYGSHGWGAMLTTIEGERVKLYENPPEETSP